MKKLIALCVLFTATVGLGQVFLFEQPSGDLTEAIPVDRIATQAALDAVEEAKVDVDLGSSDVIVLLGDSLTAGSGKWGTYLADRYPLAEWNTVAEGGRTMATMLANIDTYLDPYYNSNKTCRVIVLSAYVNDGGYWYQKRDAATALAAGIIAKGWQLSWVEMYNWGGSAYSSFFPEVNDEIKRDAIANGYSYIDGVAAVINDPVTEIIKTNYQLAVGSDYHLNSAGQLALANAVDQAIKSGIYSSTPRPALNNSYETRVAGESVVISSGSVGLFEPSIEAATGYPTPQNQTILQMANGIIADKATSRLVGSDGTNTYVCYSGAYADVAYVGTNQVCQITTGANAGVYKITEVTTVTANDIPLVGCVVNDTLIVCGGQAGTVGVVASVPVRQGRVIASIAGDNSISSGMLTIAITSQGESAIDFSGIWAAGVERVSGDVVVNSTPAWLYSSSASTVHINTYTASGRLYVCLFSDTAFYLGFTSEFAYAKVELLTFRGLILSRDKQIRD